LEIVDEAVVRRIDTLIIQERCSSGARYAILRKRIQFETISSESDARTIDKLVAIDAGCALTRVISTEAGIQQIAVGLVSRKGKAGLASETNHVVVVGEDAVDICEDADTISER
jgi:hypothetical protein